MPRQAKMLDHAPSGRAPDFACDMLDTIVETAQRGGAMPRAFKASTTVTTTKSRYSRVMLRRGVAQRRSAR